jgi:hypothetical protein
MLAIVWFSIGEIGPLSFDMGKPLTLDFGFEL